MSLSLEKITHQSLHRFPEKTDDERNKTYASRTFEIYLKYMEIPERKRYSLSKFIDNRSQELGGKIRVLDCGAGEGVAVDTLLESKLGEKIKKVTGISLHSFDNVKEVLKRHGNRVDWYLGDAIEILNKLPAEYDLLTDFNGSYYYCAERVKLLKAVHGVLNPGGRAYIKIKGDNYILVNNEWQVLEQHISEEYPETFRLEGTVLIVTKASKRCPLPDYEVDQSLFQCSLSANFKKKEALQANAWYPYYVTFKKSTTSKELRNLNIEPKTKKSKH